MSMSLIPPIVVSKHTGENDSLTVKNKGGILRLTAGERVTADVVRVPKAGKVELLFGRTRVIADTKHSFAPGERITLEVVSTHSRIVLRYAGAERGETEKVEEYLKFLRLRPRALSDAFTEVRKAFVACGKDIMTRFGADGEKLQRILTEGFFTPDRLGTGGLRSFLRGLGLWMESLYADGARSLMGRRGHMQQAADTMKGFLMEFIERWGGRGATPETDRLLQACRGLVRALEAHQVLNTVLQQNREWQFQFPLSLPTRFGVADLVIREDDEGRRNGEEASYSFSLVLDMDALGTVAVEAKMAGRTVSAAVFCEHTAASQYVTARMPELRDRLVECGYIPGSFTCDVGTGKTVAACDTGRMFPADEHVNLRV